MKKIFVLVASILAFGLMACSAKTEERTLFEITYQVPSDWNLTETTQDYEINHYEFNHIYQLEDEAEIRITSAHIGVTCPNEELAFQVIDMYIDRIVEQSNAEFTKEVYDSNVPAKHYHIKSNPVVADGYIFATGDNLYILEYSHKEDSPKDYSKNIKSILQTMTIPAFVTLDSVENIKKTVKSMVNNYCIDAYDEFPLDVIITTCEPYNVRGSDFHNYKVYGKYYIYDKYNNEYEGQFFYNMTIGNFGYYAFDSEMPDPKRK